jgi:hypothetical protein
MNKTLTPPQGANKDPKRFTWSSTYKERQVQGKQLPAGSGGGGK